MYVRLYENDELLFKMRHWKAHIQCHLYQKWGSQVCLASPVSLPEEEAPSTSPCLRKYKSLWVLPGQYSTEHKYVPKITLTFQRLLQGLIEPKMMVHAAVQHVQDKTNYQKSFFARNEDYSTISMHLSSLYRSNMILKYLIKMHQSFLLSISVCSMPSVMITVNLKKNPTFPHTLDGPDGFHLPS